MIWIKFSVTALIVVLFCISLSKYADQLAAAKRIGKGFVGLVLLGFITSIPELISTVSSTVYLNNPVLGTANIIGSNNANMFILYLSFLIAESLRRPSGKVDVESCTSLGYCFIITAVFILGIFFSGHPFYGRSLFVYLIFLLFILSVIALYKANPNVEDDSPIEALGFFFYCKLIFFAAGLVASSFYLSVVVNEIGTTTSIGSAMAGAIFLAWATSLPELVVTISSVIRGSVEMGIGNILGSNIFNMAVLALSETVSVSQTSVFEKNDGIMIFAVFQCVLLGILLILLMQEKLRRVGKIAVMPLFALILYVIGVTLL